jgi:hypothetical protein
MISGEGPHAGAANLSETDMDRANFALPPSVAALFWECDEGSVRWDRHRDAVVERVLARGDWESIQWLRRTAGDAVVREVVVRTRGRSLSPEQLRLWQLLLALPDGDVRAWLALESRRVWDRRCR